jgi:hypothetical protein
MGRKVRATGFSEGALCGNIGSMLPFAKTREERLKNKDPRLSLAERYASAGERAVAVERAAKQLVHDRLLLEEDVQGYLRRRISTSGPSGSKLATVKKVAKRGWSLDKFTKSVTAQAKRLNVKVGSAAQIKKAYDDGLSVRGTVVTFTTK